MTKKSSRRTNNCHYACSVEAALDVIGNKWKGVILYHLLSGTKRFNELRKLIPSVTQRMLTKQLRELEEDSVIIRKVYAEVPPKVEYSLTASGMELKPLLLALRDWGQRMMPQEYHYGLKDGNNGTVALQNSAPLPLKNVDVVPPRQ